MAVNGFTNIVTDGLVLSLDAGNLKSYPTTGTTWTDLSKLGGTCTLTNTTFVGSNIINFNFDGTTSYSDFFCPNLTGTATIEMLIKSNNTGTDGTVQMIFGWSLYDILFYLGHLGFNTSVGDVYGISSTVTNSLGLLNNWVHYIFVMRSDVTYVNNNKIYINGNLQTLTQIQGTENAGYRNFNSGSGRISGWRANTTYKASMNCSLVRIYNRALSASEVLQNYNATKWRFI